MGLGTERLDRSTAESLPPATSWILLWVFFIGWLKRRQCGGGGPGWIYGRDRWRGCSLSDCSHKSRDRPASYHRKGRRGFCQPLLETKGREGKAGKQLEKEVRMHF